MGLPDPRKAPIEDGIETQGPLELARFVEAYYEITDRELRDLLRALMFAIGETETPASTEDESKGGP